MVKAIHKGLAKPGSEFYSHGWNSYIGPRQNEPSEAASKDTPPKKSEENQDVQVEKTKD